MDTAQIEYSVIEEIMRQVDHDEIAASPVTLKRIIEEQGLAVSTEGLAVPFREKHPR